MKQRYGLRPLLLLVTVLLVGCADSTEESQELNNETKGVEEPLLEDDERNQHDEPTNEDETTSEGEIETINYVSEVEAQYTTSLNQELIEAHT